MKSIKEQSGEIPKKLTDRVTKIDLRYQETAEDLKSRFPLHALCVCDLYVVGSEQAAITDHGIVYQDLLLIDHHIPVPQMQNHITSTQIAINYVRRNGPLPAGYRTIVNHTDCDVVLSSMIMTGMLPPLDRFRQAALAADHTYEEDDIADLLQAVEKRKDLDYSAHNLLAYLNSQPIDTKAAEMVEERRQQRHAIRRYVKEGNYGLLGDIVYITNNTKVHASFFPPHFPRATAIVVGNPKGGKWDIKVRLGINARGIALNTLDLPDFGGRWNAGGTSRHGGTDYNPEQYARFVYESLS